MGIPMLRWLEIRRATTTKRRAQNNPLVRHPARGLTLDKHTIQETHDAPWIGAQGSNTGSVLATPGDAPLRQRCCGCGDFVRFLANMRFSVRNRPVIIIKLMSFSSSVESTKFDARTHVVTTRLIDFPVRITCDVSYCI